ncbi:FmdB family zinc ribbon protein, partial [Halomonas sp.]|uniref:FmdB family zinc ribbon protein n=1 Tax=Halomonas sp. TaxID=1486246 RepID=UPI00356134E8
MPIYEYECKACGHRLEKLQKISADPLIDCPVCEAAAESSSTPDKATTAKGDDSATGKAGTKDEGKETPKGKET